jgi:hypothetical protein
VNTVEPQQQLEFLSNIQRLLGEGQFTATYKYALLLAIADICVEDGEDDGASFLIPTSRIAEKFVTYYWPQVRPYSGVVLRQNTGKTPAVIASSVKCRCGSSRPWGISHWNSCTRIEAKAPRLN